MKITRKQEEEIDFLIEWINFESTKNYQPTQNEKEEYIKSTVLGKKKFYSRGIGGTGKNNLFDAKRELDITIKMWREGILEGTILVDELYEDFKTPYSKKLLIVSKFSESIAKFKPDSLPEIEYPFLSKSLNRMPLSKPAA